MTKARDLGDFISDGTIAETVTADGLNLGDNEKIQLGASQDLQIFHDGTNSVIKDAGTGNLNLLSDQFAFKNAAGTENQFVAGQDGAVTLYYDNAAKLATTSTGVTVTGTIAVSDSFNATSGTFTVQSNGTDILNLTSTVMSPQTDGAISLGSATNGFNNMYLDGSAYVSGNVGAGTSSPQRQIHSVDSNGEVLRLQRDGAFTGSWDLSIGTQTTGDFTVYDNENSQRAITVEKLTGFSGTSAMYIDSSGNVGIGTSDISGFGGTYKGLDVAYKGSGLAGRTDNPTFDIRSNLFYDGSNYKYGEGSTTAGILSVGGGQLIFSNAPSGTAGATATVTERMRIDSSGSVGIGTTSPATKVDINNGSADSLLTLTNSSFNGTYRAGINFQVNTFTNTPSGQIALVGDNNYSGNMIFSTASPGTTNPLTERMRISSQGAIGLSGANYGTSGQVLTSGGSGAAPTWADAAGGSFEVVSDTSFSNASDKEFTITAGRVYKFEFLGITVNNSIGGSQMLWRASSNGGVSFPHTIYYSIRRVYSSATTFSVTNGSNTYGSLTYFNVPQSNANSGTFVGEMFYYQRSGYSPFANSMFQNGDNTPGTSLGGFRIGTTSTINRLRFQPNSDTITGRIRVLRSV